jgi:hypothetical protein
MIDSLAVIMQHDEDSAKPKETNVINTMAYNDFCATIHPQGIVVLSNVIIFYICSMLWMEKETTRREWLL